MGDTCNGFTHAEGWGDKLTVFRALDELLFLLGPHRDGVLAVVPGVGHGNLASVQDKEAGELLLQHWGALFLPADHDHDHSRGEGEGGTGGMCPPALASSEAPQSQGEAWRGQGGKEGSGGDGGTHPALGLGL